MCREKELVEKFEGLIDSTNATREETYLHLIDTFRDDVVEMTRRRDGKLVFNLYNFEKN